ncbi:MAG TPA: hypothetical protein VFW73_13230 [Lacipirellulaceae bacterium]|nr:hypothetical protein [Lacipirellulaceae bacterium]
MTDKSSDPQTHLRNALADFEAALETPIVSGDLANWIDQIRQMWAGASTQVHYHIKQLHPRQYEEMAKQDAEMLTRIDLLKAEDKAIESQRDQLAREIDRVAEHAPKLEPDEEKAQQHTKRVVDDAMAFLARVRKQDVAVQTWYVEAFDRDRGAVD